MELLNQTVAWWHWIVLGLILLIVEVNTGTFLFAGFAAAALVTGLVDLLFATSFTSELLLWSILSVLAFVLWRNYFKKEPTHSVGQSDDGIGTQGVVTEAIAPHQKGRVRFDAPLLGNTEWFATADEAINAGDRVKVVEVRGQLIKVTKEL